MISRPPRQTQTNTNTTNMQREDIKHELTTILVEQLCCEREKITEDATTAELGADSLDKLNILIAVEDEFGINIDDDEAEKLTTVGEFIEFIEKAI